MVTRGYMGYHRLQGITRSYRGLQGVTGCYKGLEGVTGGYKGMRALTRGYKGLQGVTKILFLGQFCIKIKVEEISNFSPNNGRTPSGKILILRFSYTLVFIVFKGFFFI